MYNSTYIIWMGPALWQVVEDYIRTMSCINTICPLTTAAAVWKYPTLISLYVYELMGEPCHMTDGIDA